jgi:hypothetical protein
MTSNDTGFVVSRGQVRCKKPLNRTDMVRAKEGFVNGVHVWEITWPRASRGTHAVIGVATTQAPLDCAGRLLCFGWLRSVHVCFPSVQVDKLVYLSK